MSRSAWVVLVLALLVLAALLLPTVQKIRNGEGWLESAYSLKQIGLAIHTYHDVYGCLPPAVVRDDDGRPLYSWRVLLLPFLDEDRLFKQFNLKEPWDGPANNRLAQETPRAFLPARGSQDRKLGLTRYQVFVGASTAFEQDGLTFGNRDFPDGLAATLLVVEAGNAVPWSKPVDLMYDQAGPVPPLGGVFTKAVDSWLFGQRRVRGFVACFADGQTAFIRADTNDTTLRALITRNGGETIDLSKLR
jgi:hypothetical protein